MPSHKCVYISAESDSSTTISGLPSVLALFKSSSEILSNVSQVSLRIAAAFHALHLSKPDVERIIGTSPLLFGKALKKNGRIISTGSGTPFAADTLSALLPLVVDDILQNPLYWTKTLQALIISLGKAADVTLTAFGPTNVTKSLRRTLESSGIKVTETREVEIPLVDGDVIGDSDDIAIIGMSCRLPGSDSLEEFWEVLEQGRDLHTKVTAHSWFNKKEKCTDKLTMAAYNRFQKTASMSIPIVIQLVLRKIRWRLRLDVSSIDPGFSMPGSSICPPEKQRRLTQPIALF